MVGLDEKIKTYYLTAIFSVVFAIVGFSYNAWRLEVSETNSNIRTASFAVLTELSQLELIIYASHYDKNEVEGNPRKGWVKVGLIDDLSVLISQPVIKEAVHLKVVWGENWQGIASEKTSVDAVTSQIGKVRIQVKKTLSDLD